MSFAKLLTEEYVKDYLLKLCVKHAVAVFDYCYGKMGIGKLLDIPTYSKNQISITEVACIDFQGEKISSTAIRQLLECGLVHEIPKFLGNPYQSKAEIKREFISMVGSTLLPTNGRFVYAR